MMKRRILPDLVLPGLLVVCFWASSAISEPKTLLVIDSQVGDPYETVRESMLAALKKRGYTKESGFTFEYYSLGNYTGAAKNLWQHRIKKVKYDAIFLNGTLAVAAFKEIAWELSGYSFIFASVTDPVGLGVIDEYNQAPPANFTGVAIHMLVDERFDFVRKLMPNVKNIGLIYADMAQSHSYRKWIEALLLQEGWEDITFHFRQVDFIPSDGGHTRMAHISRRYILELDPIVDVFVSAHDQLGAQRPFATLLSKIATKPLIGVGFKEVRDGWGAMASIYPDRAEIGVQAAIMIDRLLKGETVQQIFPERPRKYGISIDRSLVEKAGITLPPDILLEAEFFP